MSEELKYKISLEDHFSSGAESAEGAAHRFERTVDGVKSHVSGLESKMQGHGKQGIFGEFFGEVGGKLAGAFALFELAKGAFEFGKESYELYEDQADAEENLLIAVKERKDVQESMIADAGKLQMKYGKDDADILKTQTLLMSSGRSVAETHNIISVAMGYARAKGKDWKDVANQLQGSYQGQIRELGRMEKGFKNLTKEQLESGKAVEILGERYKDFIEANTLTGKEKLSVLAESWGEFKEAIGSSLVHVVENTNIIDSFTQSLQLLTEVMNSKDANNWSTFLGSPIKWAIAKKEQGNIDSSADALVEKMELKTKEDYKKNIKLITSLQAGNKNEKAEIYKIFDPSDEDEKKIIDNLLSESKLKTKIYLSAVNKMKEAYLQKFRVSTDGDGSTIGSGLSEPKTGKIQQIIINMNNPFQNMKTTYANMELGIDDFVGKLGQALNKVVTDATILATE